MFPVLCTETESGRSWPAEAPQSAQHHRVPAVRQRRPGRTRRAGGRRGRTELRSAQQYGDVQRGQPDGRGRRRRRRRPSSPSAPMRRQRRLPGAAVRPAAGRIIRRRVLRTGERGRRDVRQAATIRRHLRLFHSVVDRDDLSVPRTLPRRRHPKWPPSRRQPHAGQGLDTKSTPSPPGRRRHQFHPGRGHPATEAIPAEGCEQLADRAPSHRPSEVQKMIHRMDGRTDGFNVSSFPPGCPWPGRESRPRRPPSSDRASSSSSRISRAAWPWW